MARQRKIDPVSGLSREALETLLDLVEIRLGSVEVYDREDARELRQLEKTRDQLHSILGLQARAPIATAVLDRTRRVSA
mgnify:CR=1 FL=1|jgi:hypothetical protein